MSALKFQQYAREIKKKTNIDVFATGLGSRSDANAFARSVLNTIYFETHKCTLAFVTRLYRDNGKPMNHATILHSLKNFEIYLKQPIEKHRQELGCSMKELYYSVLLSDFANQKKAMKLSKKLAFLTPEQKIDVRDLVDTYVRKNVQAYIQQGVSVEI